MKKEEKNIEKATTEALSKTNVGTRFLCDCCGEEKEGKKHKVYDENWNIQRGCYECNDCFASGLDAQVDDK